MAEKKTRDTGKVSALLHTNVFSLGDLIGTLRGGARWWPGVIDDADLPEAVDERVRTIVKKTRLWNAERCEVARELCNHAREALEAGRTPEEIAESLGDPKPIARLIRRSMKRKRPATWQVRAWIVRGLGVASACVVLVAAFMTVRFFVGDPTIDRNFVAELNAPIEKLDEDEKAWPLLKEAWAVVGVKQQFAWDEMNQRVLDEQNARLGLDASRDDPDARHDETRLRTGIDLLPEIPEGHPDAGAVEALYREIQPQLATMREAASRPRLGMMFSTRMTEMPDELVQTPAYHGWLSEPLPDSDDPAEQEWIVSILLPALGPTRTFAKWFAYDARVKIDEGDTEGALASVEAMIGLADQCAEDQFLIGYLVAIAIEHLAVQTVSDMMTEHGDELTDAHLVRLAHVFGAPRLDRIPLEGEEMMFEDFLQRAFTDDGSGDGYLTNEGLEMIRLMEALNASITDGIVENAAVAVQLARVGSRADQRRMAERAYNRLRAEEAAGYGIYRDVPLMSDAMVEALDQYRYMPLRIMLPAVSRVVTNKLERRARVEALLVGIAAELYRRETGSWPASATDLAPRYIPFVPEDPATGGPIAITPGEQTVTVYALGPDRDDDGGVMDAEKEREFRPEIRDTYVEWPSGRIYVAPLQPPGPETPDGDWVLFPAR